MKRDRALRRRVAKWATLWKVPRLEERFELQWSRRMTRSLGRCDPERGVARLASWLLEAPAELLAEVLCHETAHAAVRELHGARCRPHGPEWKALMSEAGYEARARFPAAALPGVAAQGRGWEHRCPLCRTERVAGRPMTVWRCLSCRSAGTRWELVRLVLENPWAIDRLLKLVRRRANDAVPR